MALKKLFASNPLTRSVVSFRSVAAFSCSFNTKGFPHEGEHVIEVDSCGEIVCHLVNTVFYSFLDKFNISRLSSTRDLACHLNQLDRTNLVKPKGYPRWDVMEDAKALYLRRDMSGLGEKDVTEYLDFPRGDHACFLDYKFDAFGFKRVYRVMRHPRAILVIKNMEEKTDRDGLNHALCIILIDLPGRLYKTLDIKREIDNEVFLVTIPKEKGNRICRLKYTHATLMFKSEKQENPTLQEIYNSFRDLL